MLVNLIKTDRPAPAWHKTSPTKPPAKQHYYRPRWFRTWFYSTPTLLSPLKIVEYHNQKIHHASHDAFWGKIYIMSASIQFQLHNLTSNLTWPEADSTPELCRHNEGGDSGEDRDSLMMTFSRSPAWWPCVAGASACGCVSQLLASPNQGFWGYIHTFTVTSGHCFC